MKILDGMAAVCTVKLEPAANYHTFTWNKRCEPMHANGKRIPRFDTEAISMKCSHNTSPMMNESAARNINYFSCYHTAIEPLLHSVVCTNVQLFTCTYDFKPVRTNRKNAHK